MRRTFIHAVLCLGLLLPFLATPPDALAQPQGGDGRPDQVVLRPRVGVGPASASADIFPPTEARRPFTHMLLRREAHVPDGAALTLAVRVSLDGTAWTGWQEVMGNDDLWQPGDGPGVEWSQTIDVGAAARFWQVRSVVTPAPGGELPELRRVDVNTVDTRAFAPAQTPAAPRLSPAAPGKPGVVSRTAWGCPDGQGSRVTPDYYPVNHMVVHHTADSNTLVGSETSWADRVRAEWSFHTYTRGWGDVGYNYLIDPNGVVYEGRAGGDDAVAFHDTGNYGSMGVVLIGTYQDVEPRPAAQDALVSLLAWKAAQKGIDPLGQSYYYGCAISRYCYPYNPGAIVANIAGHRQVRHGTECPGNQAFDILPSIRLRVKQALQGGPTDNGDLTIDNLESGFAPSSAGWHSAGCGYGGHTSWTYTTNDPGESTNSATWRPNIPTAGTYRVYAYIPQGCGLAPPPYASTQARYTITYAGGTKDVVIDHNTTTEWVDLGLYQFDKGTGGGVVLSDLTGEPLDQQKVLFFDAIKWVPENDATTNVRLDKIELDRQSVASGELLKVKFTVTNIGDVSLRSQEPQASRTPDGRFYNDGRDGRPDDAYVYDEGECFGGDSAGSYAIYPKESNRFRLVLGPDDASGIACARGFGNYPWRWGLNGDLAPGETREVVGYVRFRNQGTADRTIRLRGNVIQEYVKYYYGEGQGFSSATITVRPESFRPEGAGYDELLNPVAHVYRLGGVPDNFLARTHNPLSIPTQEYLGSFAWNGAFLDWGGGGPVAGAADDFVVEQVRSFIAPTSGTYTFGVSSDDGAWLWVDGRLVVDNSGLHGVHDSNEAPGAPTNDITGTIELSAGPHTFAFKYFERGGTAAAGYSVQLPGESGFTLLPDGLGGGAAHVGTTFVEHPEIHIAADDQGGSGIERIRWSWDGATWEDSPGARLDLSEIGRAS
jgi:hypothetical protein